MQAFFKQLKQFFETKSGLLILGFFVTTIGGSFLNYQIQNVQSRNNQNFEMYKARLSEAKAVEEKLIAISTTRYFNLSQMLVKIKHEENWPKNELTNYWNISVTSSKEDWNKNLYFLHAQLRTLFSSSLATMLLIPDKKNTNRNDDGVVEKLNNDTYNKTKPSCLHQAFYDTHATLYHILKKYKKSDNYTKNDLIQLADKQIDQLALIQSCITYRLSGELLRYPYGPNEKIEIIMPKECEDFGKINERTESNF